MKQISATMLEKNYNELTVAELKALVFAYGRSKEHYNSYRVQYNKKGEIVKVWGYELSGVANKEVEEYKKIKRTSEEQVMLNNLVKERAKIAGFRK